LRATAPVGGAVWFHFESVCEPLTVPPDETRMRRNIYAERRTDLRSSSGPIWLIPIRMLALLVDADTNYGTCTILAHRLLPAIRQRSGPTSPLTYGPTA